jgi:cobalt-zinc-cadmium efflux system membrane fusion protein
MKYLRSRHISLFQLLLPVLFIIWGCNSNEAPAESIDTFCITEELREKIAIDTVGTGAVTESRRLTGEVVYNPDKVLHYVTLVSGVITRTDFTLGDYVHRNQILAGIKSAELSGLESERKSLESKLSVANRNVSAVRSMYEDGIASGKDLLEAESEAQIIRAELEKVKTNLSFFSPSPDPGIFLIKAPASGFIVDKRITPGMQVSGGSEPLFTISDLDNVWVTANVYAGDLDYVRPGMEAQLRSVAYKGEVFSGNIQSLSQVFDAEEKVIKARIVMDNPELKLKPGMFIDVLVKKESDRQGVVLPKKAIIFNNNRHYVLVWHSDCDIEVREVTIAAENDGRIFIGEGLVSGEKVILRNHLLIFETLKSRRK